MRQINLISVVFLMLSLAALGACQATGGGARTWQLNTQNQAPAEKPPSKLASAAAITEAPQENIVAPVEAPALPAVKVALLVPLSGSHAALGHSMEKAAQMAMFDIGHTNFELMPRDTKGTAMGAKEAAEQAINDGAQLILGPVFSSAVQRVKPVAANAGVNMVAFSTDWQLAGGNTFIMGFLPFDQVERIVSYSAQRGLNRMALLAPRSVYGNTVTSMYEALAEQYQIQTIDITQYAPQTGNLSPTLRRFTHYDERSNRAEKEARETGNQNNSLVIDKIRTKMEPPFDAVLMPVGGENAVSIANLLTHYDLPPRSVRRLGTGLFDDKSLATEDGLDGAWFAAPSLRTRARFESRYQATYAQMPPRLASLAYDATALAAVLAERGLQAYGQPAFDHASITNPNGFAGIDGIFRFRPNGMAERGLAVLAYKNGRIVEIDKAPRTFQQ